MAKSKQHFFVGEIVKKKSIFVMNTTTDDGEYKVYKVELITKKDLSKATLKKLKDISRMTSFKHWYRYYLERPTDGHKEVIQGFYYNKETVLSGSVTEYEVIQMSEERIWNL